MKRFLINNKGFTIVEVLMSMGVLAILLAALTSMFVSIMDTQISSKTTSTADQDGRYLLARLTYDMHNASSITQPAAGQQGNTLQIVINSVNYTYTLNNGNLQLTNNLGTNTLNSSSTTVSGLTFQRIGNGDANDTIRMNFTIASTTQKASPAATLNFQTTLGFQ